jgi:DNA adenine methylase
LLPEKIEGYVEPFLGSGAVFFFVRKNYKPRKKILADVNGELIAAFKAVRDEPLELMELLERHREKHSEEHYYEVRNTPPSALSELEKAARFIYLNKTCFNGLYRVNGGGRFNVPMGSYKNPRVFDEKTILEASKLLQGAALEAAPFEKSCAQAESGDFVYIDPPYHPSSKTASFTDYAVGGFGEEEQEALQHEFERLDSRGCLVMLSNSDTAFIRELYGGFSQKTVKARRAINCNGAGRGEVSELVVTNY